MKKKNDASKRVRKKLEIADDGDGTQLGEVSFVVEKGSPADKILQVLKHRGFDAELTGLRVETGQPGQHQIVRAEGVLCDRHAGTSFTVWAIVQPNGMAYLLSVKGPQEEHVPVLSRFFELLVRAGESPGEGDARGGEETGDGGRDA